MNFTRAFFVALVLAAGVAHADPAAEQAKQHSDKAMAAYGLSNYPEAASEYEQAFSLKADPALLYNAAQAHRLGGNQQRALQLYQNYLLLFGRRAALRAEVERHIGELKDAIEMQQRVQHSPPTSVTPTPAPATVMPVPQPAVVATPEPSPTVTATPRADLVARAPEKTPVYKRGWFWGVVGGGVAAVAIGVGLGIGLGSHTVAPTPSMGAVGVQ